MAEFVKPQPNSQDTKNQSQLNQQRYLDVPPPKYLPNKQFGNQRPQIGFPQDHEFPRQFTPKQKYFENPASSQRLDYLERPEFMHHHSNLQPTQYLDQAERYPQNRQRDLLVSSQANNQYYLHQGGPKYLPDENNLPVKPFPPQHHMETNTRSYQPALPGAPVSHAHDYIPYDMEQLHQRYPNPPGYTQLPANPKVLREFQQIKDDISNQVPQGPRHAKNISLTNQAESQYDKKQQVLRDYGVVSAEQQDQQKPFTTLRQDYIARNYRESEPGLQFRQGYHNYAYFNEMDRSNYENQPRPASQQPPHNHHHPGLYSSQQLPTSSQPIYAQPQAVHERYAYDNLNRSSSKYQYQSRHYDGPQRLSSSQVLPSKQSEGYYGPPVNSQQIQQPREYVNRVYYNNPREQQAGLQRVPEAREVEREYQPAQSKYLETIQETQNSQEQLKTQGETHSQFSKYPQTYYSHYPTQEQQQQLYHHNHHSAQLSQHQQQQLQQQNQQFETVKKQIHPYQSQVPSRAYAVQQQQQIAQEVSAPRILDPQERANLQETIRYPTHRFQPLDYQAHRNSVMRPYTQERLERENQQAEYQRVRQHHNIQSQQAPYRTQSGFLGAPQGSRIGESAKIAPYDIQQQRLQYQQGGVQKRFEGMKYYEERPRNKYEQSYNPKPMNQVGTQHNQNEYDISDLHGPLKYF